MNVRGAFRVTVIACLVIGGVLGWMAIAHWNFWVGLPIFPLLVFGELLMIDALTDWAVK